jgi:hypothetical protein
MNKFRLVIHVLAIAMFMFALASLAQAQATRTWVSGVGDDANPCSRTAPCKTFAGAISKTAACGEINAIDSGGFGQVTITKAITIDGTGVLAGVLATSGNAININAGAGDVVTLKGLDINGDCLAADGIHIFSAKEVNIEECEIYKFTSDGIEGADNDGLAVNIRNTVVRDDGEGINASSTSGQQRWSIEHSSFIGNSLNGIHAQTSTRFNLRECVLANNTFDGAQAQSTAAGTGVINLDNCQIFGNGEDGVQAGKALDAGAGIIRISNNVISQNTVTGVNIQTGGTVQTMGNNLIGGNGGANTCAGCVVIGPGQ